MEVADFVVWLMLALLLVETLVAVGLFQLFRKVVPQLAYFARLAKALDLSKAVVEGGQDWKKEEGWSG